MTKTWFITGARRGLGGSGRRPRSSAVTASRRRRGLETLHELVEAHGDAVLPIQLDVTYRAGDFAAVKRAAEHFGRLDIVVNNAGYGHFGMVEELTEADVREQLETNFFGALWVTQAALPIMRAQGSGHIIQVRASAASAHSRASAPITPRSGRSRASRSRLRARWRASASTSR